MDNPKITSGGAGMWGSSAPASTPSGSSQNALTQVGKTSSTGTPFSGNPSGPGVGATGGSPDPGLLATGGATGSKPGVGPSGPSPDQSLLSTRGKSDSGGVRASSFGGVEKGVQIP